MYKIVISIDGMRCGMCETHINDVIRNNFDVKSVKSNRFKKITEIISNNELDLNRVKEVIDQTGYKFLGINQEFFEKKGLFSFLKKK